jgi:hypothetical protein
MELKEFIIQMKKKKNKPDPWTYHDTKLPDKDKKERSRTLKLLKQNG